MLAVGGLRLDGDVAGAQAFEPGLLAREDFIGTAFAFVLQSLRALPADAKPQQVVRKAAGLGKARGKAFLSGFDDER